jgi:hypothetical protein
VETTRAGSLFVIHRAAACHDKGVTRHTRFAIGFLFMTGAAACGPTNHAATTSHDGGGDGAAAVCAPGKPAPCTCGDGGVVHLCDAGGNGFEECFCPGRSP